MQNLLIDYLVISFKVTEKQCSCFLKWLYFKLNFPVQDAEAIRSYYGYPSCLFYRGIKIHSGSDIVVLDMSGKGCRTLEDLVAGWDWFAFLHSFKSFLTVPIVGSDYGGKKGQYAVHISRIDLACDLLGGRSISVPKLHKFVMARKFICKSDYHTCVVGNKEMALYFGSPRSDRRLRIYDKALEQGISADWTRFEFQLRDDSATSFFLNLEQVAGSFSECYYGMLHDYLRFTTAPNTGIHVSCLKVCPWWSAFVHDARKLHQLYLPGTHYDIHHATEIYKQQMTSTVKTLLEAYDGDVSMIASLAEQAPLNKHQREALQEWKVKQDNEEEQAVWDNYFAEASANSSRIMATLADLNASRERSQLDKAAEVREYWTVPGADFGVDGWR